ncbi:MAG: septal ring lytic transglycosylase RlpA family protein [Acidobacteriaceae bacterium]|nr:septal ring lytic transglycosylase RlpA family protein [Acidobacteriaceae bacterium]
MLLQRLWRLRADALAVALGLLLSGCAHKHHRAANTPKAPRPVNASRGAAPVQARVGYTEDGVASWYGVPYNGRPAADGEIYDMETLVAAHRLMPFNTWLKVTNLANDKSVDVRIIDRGPFVDGRIIDLSKAAARQIDLLGPGVGRVRLEVIAAPAVLPANNFYAVQVGAFSMHANAESLRAKYAQRFGNAQLVLKQGATPLWRVLVGKEPSIDAAQQLAIVLGAEKRQVFVVRLDETLPGAPAPAGN